MVVEEVVNAGGFFERLKEAIAGVGCGFVMVLIAVCVLFWGERRAVRRAQDLEAGQGLAVETKADKVDANNEKKLVVVAGNANTTEVLKDVKFEVEATAIKLSRKVEMYQWAEKTKEETRGSKNSKKTVKITYYEKEWSSSVIDSASFKEKKDPDTGEMHVNPATMPFEQLDLKASLVTLGAFKLPPALIDSINNWQNLTPKAVPASMQGGGGSSPEADGKTCPECSKTLKSAQGLQQHMKDTGHKASASSGGGGGGIKLTSTGFYKGNDPASPQIGDVRITFQQVPPSDVTVLGQQLGDSFGSFSHENLNDPLYELRLGKKTKTEFFAQLEQENTILTWGLRFGGWLFCVIGISLILRPITVVADAVPFVGGIVSMGVGCAGTGVGSVIALMTIAFGWIFYRPLIGIPLFLLAVGIIVGLFVLAAKKKGGGGAAPAVAAGGDAPPPAPADPAPAA